MAGGANGDTGGEVEESVAVDVFDDRAVAALGDQGIVARERRRHEPGVLLDHMRGFGSRELHQQAGQFRFAQFRFASGDHFFLLQGWSAVFVDG